MKLKFSLVIPTKNRPDLLRLCLEAAMNGRHRDIEIIVSDNSSSEEFRKLNAELVHSYSNDGRLMLVAPERMLSMPEHFEYALNFVSGDYVTFLTDKMVLLPDTIVKANCLAEGGNYDIINWGFSTYKIEDYSRPTGQGVLFRERNFLDSQDEEFIPRSILEQKALCSKLRSQQSMHEYVTGKLVFGSYSLGLVTQIRQMSGKVFGGSTHDYSAMVQALSLAQTGILMRSYGILFVALPSDKSVGSLTDLSSEAARRYFNEFPNSKNLLEDLLVPGVYSSQHNMVAHDYLKYLSAYGLLKFFNIANWLSAIHHDLENPLKVWGSVEERRNQISLFENYLETLGDEELGSLSLTGSNMLRGDLPLVHRLAKRFPHHIKPFLRSLDHRFNLGLASEQRYQDIFTAIDSLSVKSNFHF